jgi:hypothetical protein
VSETVEPFSDSVQVGMRLPAVLVALAGVVLALVLIRRFGVLAGILGALGSLFSAADQVVNIAWFLHMTQLWNTHADADSYNSVDNAYFVADVVLATLGVALLIGAFAAAALRRGAAPTPAGYPQQPPFPQQQPFPQQALPQQAPPVDAL